MCIRASERNSVTSSPGGSLVAVTSMLNAAQTHSDRSLGQLPEHVLSGNVPNAGVGRGSNQRGSCQSYAENTRSSTASERQCRKAKLNRSQTAAKVASFALGSGGRRGQAKGTRPHRRQGSAFLHGDGPGGADGFPHRPGMQPTLSARQLDGSFGTVHTSHAGHHRPVERRPHPRPGRKLKADLAAAHRR